MLLTILMGMSVVVQASLLQNWTDSVKDAYSSLWGDASADDFENTYPTIIFHGVHDHCKNAQIHNLTANITSKVPTHVECIDIGGGLAKFTSVFMKFTE